MATGLDELKNIFKESDEFKLVKDSDLDENDADGKYKYFVVTNKDQKAICKVYNPEELIDDKKSIIKRDQSWYKQLMIFRECLFLNQLHHPAIADFKGINLYNASIKYTSSSDDEEEEEEEEDQTNQNNDPETKPTIFLEYISRGSLSNFIADNERKPNVILTPAQRQICILGITSAIHYLHIRNIIHRNLSPKSIWLDENYYPKIFDFSTSREIEQAQNGTPTELESVSALYQAPELLDHLTSYDNSIDIFALGRVLYYFITGFQPFKYRLGEEKDPNRSKASHMLQREIIDGNAFPYLPDSIPEVLKDLLLRCWSLNPSDRPTSTEMFIRLKDEILVNQLKSEKDIAEYEAYKKLIEEIDYAPKCESNFGLVSKLSFDFEQFYDDKVLVYTNVEEEKSKLDEIISCDFNIYSPDQILKLLNDMIKDKSIMEENYLPKVIDYVNKQNILKEKAASEFLKSIFGDYIISSEKTVEISAGLIKDKSIRIANIPPWVRKIKKGAFSNMKKLKLVNIPNTVTAIEKEAFSDCPKLKFVNIPISIEDKNLGEKAFKNCSSLKYIKVPPNLTVIKAETLKNCTSLSEVVLNDTLQVIEKEAFYGCTSLIGKQFIFSNSLIKTGRNALDFNNKK